MSELIQKLEELYNVKQSNLGESTKAQALYDKILDDMNKAVVDGNTFDSNGDLVVYTVQIETNLLNDFNDDVQRKNLSRLNYIKANRSYLEWYFTKALSVPGYRFVIKTNFTNENSLLNKKTKTTLNILLQRPS